jgi:dihydrofolate reductase
VTTGHVFIAQSLDGFIARPDGGLDWLMACNTTGEDYGYDAFIAGMDGIVMGRGTYETVLAFDPWPYALPVFVLSSRLAAADIPGHLRGRVEILDLAPPAVMDVLARRGLARVYVDGGRVVQSFLAAGLIAEMTVTTAPVLIGAGRPLFGPLAADVPVDHVDTTAFRSGHVRSHWRIRRAGRRLTGGSAVPGA